MRGWRNKAAAVLLAAAVVATSMAPAFAKEKAPEGELRFREDGSFTIMLLTDAQDTNRTKPDTVELIEASLDEVKPDLVILMGDNIAGSWFGARIHAQEKAEKAIGNIVGPIAQRRIPFALVFGNHDPASPLTLEEQIKIYQSYPGCLAVDDGPALTGCGTYRLPILRAKGEKAAFQLWFFDSGEGESLVSYSSPAPDQIAWYVEESKRLTAENGGVPIPALAFQHVAVPEIYQTFRAVEKGTQGAVKGWSSKKGQYWLPDPACAVEESRIQGTRLLEGPRASDNGNGEFDAWLACGDVIGAYFAHDHKNEYVGNYKGIDLGYAPGCGFNSYGNGGERAMRVIELQESAPQAYRSHLVYYRDVVGHDPSTSWRDCMLGNYLNIGGPYVLLAVGCIVGLGGIFTAGRSLYRKRKGK